MSRTLHTPYDGRSPLFRIGAVKLDPAEWIDVDDRLPLYLAEKQRLFAGQSAEVFAAEPGTELAQVELLEVLADHLPSRFPDTYRLDGDTIEIMPAARQVDLRTSDIPPLERAASLVQEDLVLMRRGDDGWRVAAGALCFPSSWRLRDKVGRPIHEVHTPVPGFGAGTRNAELIGRMFDMLRPETPMLRWNWSLYGDDALFHPDDPQPRRFGDSEAIGPVFLRVERQTLRRLLGSGDIAFTIRIYVDPLEALDRHPEGNRIAAALAAQIEALDPAQLAYKGLALERDRLLARLGGITVRTREHDGP